MLDLASKYLKILKIAFNEQKEISTEKWNLQKKNQLEIL